MKIYMLSNLLFASNIISYITITNLETLSIFFNIVTHNIFTQSQGLSNNIFLWYYGLCFLALFILPFLHKKFQNIIWGILIFLLIGTYFGIILYLVLFDLFLYYSANYISKKYNLKIKEIKNISAFQYFSKFFPFVGFLSFFRLGLSNKLEIKKILKISFLSSLYSFFIIWYTYLIVFLIGEFLIKYTDAQYEPLIVWWQFLVVGIYAMLMYYLMKNKEK